MKLKNRIEKVRILLGLFQYKLGEEVGVSRISIYKIETGKSIFSLILAYKIANILGVCIYQLFDLTETGNYECEYCVDSN